MTDIQSVVSILMYDLCSSRYFMYIGSKINIKVAGNVCALIAGFTTFKESFLKAHTH